MLGAGAFTAAKCLVLDNPGAVIEAVDQASKTAPGTGDVAMAAVKSTMAATTAAFDTLNKAARQVASYADAGVKVAKAPKPRK